MELYSSLASKFGITRRGYVGAYEAGVLAPVEATLEYHTRDSGLLTSAYYNGLTDAARWGV